MSNIDLPKPPPARFVVILGILSFLIFIFSWMYTDSSRHTQGLGASMVMPSSGAMGVPSATAGPSYGYGGGVAKGIAMPSTPPDMMAYDGDGNVSYGQDQYVMEKPMPVPPVIGSTPPSGSKIIRAANLALLVHDTDEAAAGIREIRVRYNGQPGNEQFNEYREGMRSGTMTIWVPSEHFDEALHDVKALALRVNNESVSVTDMSAQFTDLEAQLRNQKAAEAQYLEIMKRSGKVGEVLQVAQALVATRQQIEYLQGQIDQIGRQVALSSITVSLTPEAKPGDAASEWRPGTVAKEAAKMLVAELTLFANMLIVSAIGLPGLILELAFYGLILWLLIRLGRYIARKISGKSLIPPKTGV